MSVPGATLRVGVSVCSLCVSSVLCCFGAASRLQRHERARCQLGTREAKEFVASDVAEVVPPVIGTRVDDDYLTVTMLSAGLAGILRRRSRAGQGDGRSEGLLPAPWRVAFSRLWWRCHEQGVP